MDSNSRSAVHKHDTLTTDLWWNSIKSIELSELTLQITQSCVHHLDLPELWTSLGYTREPSHISQMWCSRQWPVDQASGSRTIQKQDHVRLIKTRVTRAMHTIYIYNCSLVTTLHCFIIYSKFPILHKYLIPRFYCFVSNRRNVKLQALNLTFVFCIWADFLCTRWPLFTPWLDTNVGNVPGEVGWSLRTSVKIDPWNCHCKCSWNIEMFKSKHFDC